MGKKIFIIWSLILLAVAGCSDEIDPPSGVSNLPPQPETPRGLTASIGDGQIVLKWTASNQTANDMYVVYYSDSAAYDMLVFDSTENFSDTVDGLVNGRRYYFRVSAVDLNGLEGLPSTPVSGTPGNFAIAIAGGNDYVNSRDVAIGVTAPSGTSLLQLSEDSQFGDARWEIYTSSKTFELSDGDGLKTVYARFEMESGGYSVGVVSDNITLDRIAVIDEFKVFVGQTHELTGDTLLMERDTLRFEVHVSEAGSAATVDIDGLGQLTLNDYGIGGDRFADDGIYGGEDIIPDETEVAGAAFKARFTDVAGNQSPEVISNARLSVSSIPAPVTAWAFPVSSLEVQVLWNPTEINDFSRYRVFRAACASYPCADSVLAIQIVKSTDSKFFDAGLDANTNYIYWIYLDDMHGNSSRSTNISVRTLENKPPDTLMINVQPTSDSLSARIEWVQSSKVDDFRAYYVFRDIAPLPDYDDADHTSYPADKVIKFISEKETMFYLDTNLPDIGLYYYQVYVVDWQGMVSRSNQDTVRVE